MATKDPITVTPAAWAHIGRALGGDPSKAFHISVDSRGCAGHKYAYRMIDASDISPRDGVMRSEHGTVVIDGTSIFHLLGSKLDLTAEGLNTRLSWDNPMASGTCGCGDSFSTEGKACSDDHGTDPEAVFQ